MEATEVELKRRLDELQGLFLENTQKLAIAAAKLGVPGDLPLIEFQRAVTGHAPSYVKEPFTGR